MNPHLYVILTEAVSFFTNKITLEGIIMSAERIRHAGLRNKIMTAEQAAEFIQNGMTLGITGFTGAGYPKALPTAIANKAKAEHAANRPFSVGVITGASTAPECDGMLA